VGMSRQTYRWPVVQDVVNDVLLATRQRGRARS
jgi:hypothetical protein